MSQALLIDSDILVDHLRKEQSALDYIQQEIDDGSPLFISVISRIEILSGARKGEDETIRSLFDILTSVDVDLVIADGAGEYLRKFREPCLEYWRCRDCRHRQRDGHETRHPEYQALSDEGCRDRQTLLSP